MAVIILLITIANQKGGTGKTTLAVMLASRVMELQESEIVCSDLDEQRSFIRRAKNLIIKKHSFKWIENPLEYVKTKKTICICDTAPGVLLSENLAMQAMMKADLLVIPLTPDVDSAFAAVRMAELVNPSNVAVIRQASPARDSATMDFLRSKNVFKQIFLFKNSNRLATNVDVSSLWYSGLQISMRVDFKSMLDNILGAANGTLE